MSNDTEIPEEQQDSDDAVDKMLHDALGDQQDEEVTGTGNSEGSEPDILELFPTKPTRTLAGFKYIDVADIWSPYPIRRADSGLRTSVKQFGVINPIQVMDQERDGRKFRLVDGQRRLSAVQEEGLKKIPAVFVADGDPCAVSLTQSATDDDNPAAELFFIEDLIQHGYSQKQIQTATRLSAGTFKKRLRLKALIPRLRDPFDRGEIAVAVAQGCADLPVTTQERLAALFEQRSQDPDYSGPCLTAKDVREERQAARQAAGAQTGLGFEDETEDDADEAVSRADLLKAFTMLWESYEQTEQGASEFEALDDDQMAFIASVAARLGLHDE